VTSAQPRQEAGQARRGTPQPDAAADGRRRSRTPATADGAQSKTRSHYEPGAPNCRPTRPAVSRGPALARSTVRRQRRWLRRRGPPARNRLDTQVRPVPRGRPRRRGRPGEERGAKGGGLMISAAPPATWSDRPDSCKASRWRWPRRRPAVRGPAASHRRHHVEHVRTSRRSTSSVARTRCARVVPRVHAEGWSPRIGDPQSGPQSPVSGGTNTTPPRREPRRQVLALRGLVPQPSQSRKPTDRRAGPNTEPSGMRSARYRSIPRDRGQQPVPGPGHVARCWRARTTRCRRCISRRPGEARMTNSRCCWSPAMPRWPVQPQERGGSVCPAMPVEGTTRTVRSRTRNALDNSADTGPR